ncbi:MAG: hypothetical protein ACR2PH_16390, partial [Desulfobulbia bacterium]
HELTQFRQAIELLGYLFKEFFPNDILHFFIVGSRKSAPIFLCYRVTQLLTSNHLGAYSVEPTGEFQRALRRGTEPC